MKVLDPQSAVLTNVEVLAHFSLNPPRRSPNPPPNSNPRTFQPSPDLRDHNTVVKEFHDYVTRLSPHLLKYPSFVPGQTSAVISASAGAAEADERAGQAPVQQPDGNETPLDTTLRTLITRMKPFRLTKGEVLMMVNLGIGLPSAEKGQARGEGEEANGVEEAGEAATIAGQGDASGVNGIGGDDAGEDTVMQDGEVDVADGEAGVGDYGSEAILSSVIEDRVERLTDEHIYEILAILKQMLGSGQRACGAVTEDIVGD